MAIKLKQRKAEVEALLATKKALIEEKKQSVEEKFQTAQKIIQQKLDNKEITAAQAEILFAQAKADAEKDSLALAQEVADLTREEIGLNTQLDELGQSNSSNWTSIASTVSVVGGGLLSLISGSQS